MAVLPTGLDVFDVIPAAMAVSGVAIIVAAVVVTVVVVVILFSSLFATVVIWLRSISGGVRSRDDDDGRHVVV